MVNKSFYMFKTKYRIEQHPDKEGYPNHYAIQRKRWFDKNFKFMFGFVARNEDPADYIAQGFGLKKYYGISKLHGITPINYV